MVKIGMNSQRQPANLDEFLLKQRCDCRLETSLSATEVNTLGAETFQMYRPGLGMWKVFGVTVSGWGELILGSPIDDEGAGMSIWFTKTPKLNNAMVARMICEMSDVSDASFLDATTGQVVTPLKPEPKSKGLPLSGVVQTAKVDHARNFYSGVDLGMFVET